VPLAPLTRLPRHYLLEMASGQTVCEACQVPLRRQRSSISYAVGLLLGEPRIRSIQKQCPMCHRIYRSEECSEWVPAHGNYAFDIIVKVGLSRFLRYRQNREIQQELDEGWGLALSCSTISELAQSFLDYLSATHQAHIPELREFLHKDGGYALHVDGTCEAGTEIIFNAVAGNRGWTLAGCKMATEDITQIQGLLQRCVEWFGRPLALVRDLSAQIDAAHQQAMPDVLDLICHYHFLENVGTKLCEKHHAKLIACLRRLKTRPALCSLRRDLVRYAKQNGSLTPAQIDQLLTKPEEVTDLEPAQRRRALSYMLLRWVEDYGSDLQGEYFPFDLPSLALYRRCCTAHGWLVQTVAEMNSPSQTFCTLETILHHLAAVVHDKEIAAVAGRLEKAASLFNELRDVLRLSSDGRHPLLHQRSVADSPTSARQREEHLQKWIDQLNHQRTLEGDSDRVADFTIVLDYLHKYDHKLTGHAIALNDRTEPFMVQRTNNISERRFGRTKQGLRRKLGTKNLARYVQAMRPEELLVENLNDPDYLQIVCGGSLETLAASFAQNHQAGQLIRSQRRAKKSVHPIPVGRKDLRDDGFLSMLKRAVAAAVHNITKKCIAA
jgi:hypothetical protein